jgi:hypothetical protein
MVVHSIGHRNSMSTTGRFHRDAAADNARVGLQAAPL